MSKSPVESTSDTALSGILSLPPEMVCLIAAYLSNKDFMALSATCRLNNITLKYDNTRRKDFQDNLELLGQFVKRFALSPKRSLSDPVLFYNTLCTYVTHGNIDRVGEHPGTEFKAPEAYLTDYLNHELLRLKMMESTASKTLTESEERRGTCSSMDKKTLEKLSKFVHQHTGFVKQNPGVSFQLTMPDILLPDPETATAAAKTSARSFLSRLPVIGRCLSDGR